jgi:predicted DsbA family dithiol-disulfide isomerase
MTDMPGSVTYASAGTITVWSDIGCPWASLALCTLRSASALRSVELRIDHRAFPLELFNNRPTPKPVLDVEIAAIAALRPELGWQAWSAPDWTYPVTTLPAMAAVQVAKRSEVGGLIASDQLDEALRHAWYAESRCISSPSVILDVAAQCSLINSRTLAQLLAQGAGLSEVYEQWAIAQTPMIEGSPHIFVGQIELHNPGVTYHWTAPQGQGSPRFETYDDTWTHEVLDVLDSQGKRRPPRSG